LAVGSTGHLCIPTKYNSGPVVLEGVEYPIPH